MIQTMPQTKTWKSNCFPSLNSHIFVLSVAQNCPKTVSLYVFPNYIIVSFRRLSLAPSLSFWKQRILPTIFSSSQISSACEYCIYSNFLKVQLWPCHSCISKVIQYNSLLHILCWLPTTLSMKSGHLSMAFKVLPYLGLPSSMQRSLCTLCNGHFNCF